MVTVYTSKAQLEHDTGDHVESKWRLVATHRAINDCPFGERLTIEDPGEATLPDILETHTREQAEKVQGTVHAGRGWLDSDTVVAPGSMGAALSAIECAKRAAVAARDGEPAFAVARPPGHHATRDRAMGFCLFNNVSIAARRLLDSGSSRVAIVDHDVHHGNGTQDIWYDDPRVLFVSLHQSPFYPGTGAINETGAGEGEGFTFNIPLPAGTGHDGYLECLDAFVVPVLDQFDPEVVLVSAGFDAHHDDPIGGCRLVDASWPAILDRVASDRPVACIMEGGYDLDALGHGVVNELAWMLGEDPPFDEKPLEGKSPAAQLREGILAAHGDRWSFD